MSRKSLIILCAAALALGGASVLNAKGGGGQGGGGQGGGGGMKQSQETTETGSGSQNQHQHQKRQGKAYMHGKQESGGDAEAVSPTKSGGGSKGGKN